MTKQEYKEKINEAIKCKNPSIMHTLITTDEFANIDTLNQDAKIMFYNMFYVYGYPVEEGSPEWALWQMQKGEKVTHPKCIYGSYWFLRGNKVVQSCNMSETEYITTTWVMERVKTGWQLYEPKPESSPDRKIQNCDPLSLSITDLTEIIGLCLFNLAGKKGEPSSSCLEGIENKLKDMLIVISGTGIEPPNIVKEGSTEWAAEMLKLGKSVIRECHEYPYTLGDDGKVYTEYGKLCKGTLCEWLSKRKGLYGWMIYEEPEKRLLSELKIGDWVDSNNKGHGIITHIDTTDHAIISLVNGEVFYVWIGYLSKLKPSDVVLDFGSGIKGEVRKILRGSMFSVEIINDEGYYGEIPLAMLNDNTRQLVEKLLAAQEEE